MLKFKKDSAALDLLLKALKDEGKYKVQIAAAKLLGKIGYTQAEEQLIKTYVDSQLKTVDPNNFEVQTAILIKALLGRSRDIKIKNKPNFSRLCDLLTLPFPNSYEYWRWQRLGAIKALEKIALDMALDMNEVTQAVNLLISHSVDMDPNVQKAAKEALLKFADTREIDEMDELIKDLEGSSVLEVRENIAKILGNIMDTSIVDLFIKWLGSTCDDRQITMVQLLSPLMDRPDIRIRATKPLIRLLRGRVSSQYIMVLLSKIGSDAVDPLIGEVNESGIEFYTHCRDLIDQFVNSYGSVTQLKEWQTIRDIKEQEKIEYERKKEASEQSSEVHYEESEEDWCDHAPMGPSDFDYDVRSDGH